MRRLVYAPYVQAFVKTDHGVVDVSPYITAGSVNRKLRQVSSAQLTLRNPVQGGTNNLLWTEHTFPDGTVGPLFHPQDPIIIVMTRLASHDVPIFTGYLDKTPYIQLYPGLCTLEASCTLKRLLYTQWDAALPFVQYFLQQFGWQLNSDSGIMNVNAEQKRIQNVAGQIKGHFNDGSIGALLFAVLEAIGGWDPSTIWIESLPPQIKDVVITLYHQIETEVQQGEKLFQSLLEQILGSNAYGTGSPTGQTINGSGGTITGTSLTNSQKQVASVLLSVGQSLNASNLALRAVICAAFGESDLGDDPTTYQPNRYSTSQSPQGYWGVLQGAVSTWPDPHDIAGMAQAFFTGRGPQGQDDFHTGALALSKTLSDPGEIATQIEVSDRPGSYYDQFDSVAQQIVANFTPKGGIKGSSLTPGFLQNTTSTPPQTKQGRSPGGKKGTSAPPSSGYVNPFSTNPTPSRVDMGVDYSGSNIVISTIGRARIYAARYDKGWQPGGGFVGYTLLDGDHAGQNVYVAENITVSAKQEGTTVPAGTPIATMNGGIETGWADPGKSITTWFATQSGIDWKPYDNSGTNYATEAGKDFNNFLTSLGVPGGSIGPPIPGDKYTGIQSTGGPGGSPGGGTGGGTGSGSGSSNADTASAAAFSTFINLPSIFSQVEALALSGKRSFMADQPLFPFIEQLCQASMREFMSMPNGNFFAFFPDYFGLFGRKPYWEIHDIEIIDCRIDLSDDPLVTHVAVAGDVTQFHGTVDFFDLVQTSGIFTIFDAITTGVVGKNPDPSLDALKKHKKVNTTKKSKKDTAAQTDKKAALAFLQRYGARPYVEQAPMVRSPFYELFLAFQKFMLLWAKQFQTTIELTFMPELFPGGLVSLPDHHLQLFVEEVVHSFDYQSGFTTTVNISAPSRLDDQSRTNISEGLARDALPDARDDNYNPKTGFFKHGGVF